MHTCEYETIYIYLHIIYIYMYKHSPQGGAKTHRLLIYTPLSSSCVLLGTLTAEVHWVDNELLPRRGSYRLSLRVRAPPKHRSIHMSHWRRGLHGGSFVNIGILTRSPQINPQRLGGIDHHTYSPGESPQFTLPAPRHTATKREADKDTMG